MQVMHPLAFNKIMDTANLAEVLDPTDLQNIGREVTTGFKEDLGSREDWEAKYAEVLKTAMQVAEDKTFPWQGAANVRMPLITLAALQFSARAYPQLVNDPDLVRCKNYRPSPDPQIHKAEKALAERIGAHMSYQILQETTEWSDDFDRSLIVLALVGSCFKKTWWDPYTRRNRSVLITPNDFVVNYWTTRLEKALRVTHRLWLTVNDIESRIRRKVYVEAPQQVEGMAPTVPGPVATDTLTAVKDTAQGMHAAKQPAAVVEMLEQHCWLDIDGDGYEEPYVVTVERESGIVRRLSKRWDPEDVAMDGDVVVEITPTQHFTKYTFVPSPDGGFYEMGLGMLLGHINETVNTLMNQLLDSGTLQTTSGGFMARGVKLKGGAYSFRPFEFQRADCSPADLKNGIMLLPTREPSQVLLALLQVLLQYGERLVGATEEMTGISPGQNTPAETSRNVMEAGLKVYASVIQRVYRGMTQEFRLWFRLNQRYYIADTKGDFVSPTDYQNVKESQVLPASDPTIVSDGLRMAQAQALLQVAAGLPPGVANMREVLMRWSRAQKIQDPDEVFPDPQGPNALPPMPNPKIQVEQIKAQQMDKRHTQQFILGLLREKRQALLNAAQAKKAEADAGKAHADAAMAPVHAAAVMADADLKRSKTVHDMTVDQIDQMIREQEQINERANNGAAGGGMAGQPGDAGGAGVPAEQAGGDTGGVQEG